jgi:hypothetical protein
MVGTVNYYPPAVLITTQVARIWRFPARIAVHRFYNVIFPVECFISDQLYLHVSIADLFYRKNGHILGLLRIDGHPQYNLMNISIHIIGNHDEIHQFIPIQIKIIDPCFFII